MLYFQAPGVADALFDADPERSLRWFLRRALPGERPLGAGSRLALQKSFPGWDPAAEARSQLLSDGDLAVFVDAFTRLRLHRRAELVPQPRPQLARAAGRGRPRRRARPDDHRRARRGADSDHGAGNGALGSDLETHRVAGSGHWTQQEKPREVNALLLDWLDRRFPLG